MKAEKIINYLRSGFSLFWLKTFESDRIRKNIYKMIKSYKRKDGNKYKIIDWTMTKEANPLKVLEELNTAEPFTILFAYNFHWFADKPQIVQFIQDMIIQWQSSGKALVSVSPLEKIPIELSKDFVLMELPLPNKDEIITSIYHVIPDDFDEILEDEENKIVNACKGLSHSELESVLALSFVSTGGDHFSIKEINEHKAMSINKTGFLDVINPNISFENIVGYENIKTFILETIDNPKAKGIMTIGPPGCGKTTLMKAIAGETKRFGIAVNMGKLFSKFQGETDQNVNTVIQIINAIGPCIVLIDEFEKQFAGASGDGNLDSGTTRRVTGRWLDFLQNRPEGVYIVGTANSFNGIPPEYLRPGRWDTSPFFIDLPLSKTRRAILEYYLKKEGVKEKVKDFMIQSQMEDFTGAEIEALVHIAVMRNINLTEALECIIPMAKVDSEKIQNLRKWAKNRTIPAEKTIPKGNSKKDKTHRCIN